MKKKSIIIIALFIGLFSSIKAQNNDFESFFSVKIGVNVVDNGGDFAPFDSFTNSEKMAFSNPFAIGVDYRFNRLLSIGLFGSINKWEANKDLIDGIFITEDVDYFSVDLNVKLYVDELIFGNKDTYERNWLDLYITLGGGYFQEQDSGISGNLGLGTNVWISDKFGVNIEGVGKFSGKEVKSSNHFQFFAGLTYRFVGDKKEKTPNEEENNGITDEEQIKEVEKTLEPEVIIINKDSDNDGVTDDFDKCPEIPGIVTNYGCPDDSDGDKNSEESEVINEVIEVKLNRLSEKVNFKTGNYNFTQDSYPILIEISEILKKLPSSSKIMIEGHTDSSGSFVANKVLSRNRANAVKNYLIDSGVIANITVIGYGELRPIGSNLSIEGRELNRRVEIIIEE